MSETIGIVGIGLMGSAISHHLIQSGFKVKGFDMDPLKLDEFAERGGIPVHTPSEVANGVKWMVLSLPDSNVVNDVVFRENGILDQDREGLIICDASTSRPEDSENLGKELALRKIKFLDTCVSGTSAMAWKKDLIVVAGGERVDFEKSLPYMQSFSRAAYYMGSFGSGALTKLIINLVLAGNRLALGEGLTLGTKAGMNPLELLTVLQDGACGSKTMLDKGPKMIQGDYSPEGRMTTKTSRLMLEQGARYGSPMFLTSLWNQLVQAGCELGLSDHDPVAFHEVQRIMAGFIQRSKMD